MSEPNDPSEWGMDIPWVRAVRPWLHPLSLLAMSAKSLWLVCAMDAAADRYGADVADTSHAAASLVEAASAPGGLREVLSGAAAASGWTVLWLAGQDPDVQPEPVAGPRDGFVRWASEVIRRNAAGLRAEFHAGNNVLVVR